LPFVVTARDVDVPFTVQPFDVVKAIRYVLDEYTPERFDVVEQLANKAEATPVALDK
jgi:hypothetical protein